MILRNKKGKERNFKLLMKYNNDKNVYFIYEDIFSKKIYAGKKCNNNLESLNDDEYLLINNILERING